MIKTFDEGRDEIAKLCQYFTTNQEAFFAPGVKEAHIRQMLIDPFFEALGWDVANRQRIAPQYREVIPEDSLDIDGQRKAPDYTFRIGTLPKYFAEAKKCGVNIQSDPMPAYQLRRYGWSAKVGLSVLTDFEEFSAYDCSARPRESDRASQLRILHVKFGEYPDRWRELWDVFSREAVWSGAFDQYVASKRKRGTSEVDVEFLKEIESWRKALAGNIALRNKKLSLDDLSAAVQRTIDRIVFLRMAEDRGLEPDEQLLKLCERPDIYQHFMRDVCRKADDKYNSGLFHFQNEIGVAESPDRTTPGLSVDDKVMKPIIQSLYFAHGSPYNFKVMPLEILGTVYERFLGKVIELTASHQARIKEKPEVRKAGGVYYTPAYIVEYIVRETVGRQMDGRSPAQLAGGKGKSPLRVLDMACGSGSFLLGAYQYLLDHCLKWYIDHKPETHKKGVYKDPRSGEWRLTIEEKKRILTTHIFGVDIDPQAVEVSKLSLLLKALEGENDATLSMQFKLFHERALPNLAENIKCGNSLVGPDYFTDRLQCDADEIKRVNAFDWSREFPAAMNAGGFDCVIGNPPYVLLQNMQSDETQLSYLKSRYAVCAYKIDTYHLFLEKATSQTRLGGSFGFIVPNTFLRNQHAVQLRSILLAETNIELIRLFDYPVFAGASVDTTVIVATRKSRPIAESRVRLFRSNKIGTCAELTDVAQSQWEKHSRREFLLGGEEVGDNIRSKIESRSFVLGEIATAYFGIQTFDRDKYVSDTKVDARYRPVVDGVNIRRYVLSNSSEFVMFTPRAIKSGGKEAVYKQSRIGVRQIGQVPIATWLPAEIYTLNTIYNIFIVKPTKFRLQFVLAVINSAVTRWYWRQQFFDQKRTFPKIKKPDLLAIRIPALKLDVEEGKVPHDRLSTLTENMIRFHAEIAVAKSAAQQSILQRQINATDAEIDRLVYDLYGLSPAEIAIVEGNTAANATTAE